MSSGSQPTPPSPTQSAQAQASSQLAGEQFQAMNAPILALQDANVRSQVSPYESALATALGNRSALSTATANRAIQYQTDPQAYQGREMALQGANNRVASLYGVNPSQYSFTAPGAFNLPPSSQLPDLGTISALARQYAGQLGSVSINQGGPNSLQFPGQSSFPN
jgi:hypothetical protein